MIEDDSNDYEVESDIFLQTVGHTFLEKLALMLIDAHPINDKNNRETRDSRLRTAMHALVPPYDRHGLHGNNDDNILYWMAAQELKQNSNNADWPKDRYFIIRDLHPIQFISVRELANHAINYFGLKSAKKKNIIDRLSRQYNERCIQLKATLMHSHSYPHEADHEILELVQKHLNRTYVRSIIPDHPSAFWVSNSGVFG